jgi:hypothetical protein
MENYVIRRMRSSELMNAIYTSLADFVESHPGMAHASVLAKVGGVTATQVLSKVAPLVSVEIQEPVKGTRVSFDSLFTQTVIDTVEGMDEGTLETVIEALEGTPLLEIVTLVRDIRAVQSVETNLVVDGETAEEVEEYLE